MLKFNREEYQENHRESNKNYYRRWYQLNKEKHALKMAEWYKQNKEYCNKKNKEWQVANKEKVAKQKESYHKEHPDKVKLYSQKGRRKYRARKMNAEGAFTENEWLKLKKKYGNMCLCCGKSESNITITRDHIIPLSRGGSDNIENIQPLCKPCNCIKHTTIIDFRGEYHNR